MEHRNNAINYSFGYWVPFNRKLFRAVLVKNYGNLWTSAAKYLWFVVNPEGFNTFRPPTKVTLKAVLFI
jgi:hypothetical protein